MMRWLTSAPSPSAASRPRSNACDAVEAVDIVDRTLPAPSNDAALSSPETGGAGPPPSAPRCCCFGDFFPPKKRAANPIRVAAVAACNAARFAFLPPPFFFLLRLMKPRQSAFRAARLIFAPRSPSPPVMIERSSRSEICCSATNWSSSPLPLLACLSSCC